MQIADKSSGQRKRISIEQIHKGYFGRMSLKKINHSFPSRGLAQFVWILTQLVSSSANISFIPNASEIG